MEDIEKGSMMDEALSILNEEGFALPDDVLSTLRGFSRSFRRRTDDRYNTLPEGLFRSTTQKTRDFFTRERRWSPETTRLIGEFDRIADDFQRGDTSHVRSSRPTSDSIFQRRGLDRSESTGSTGAAESFFDDKHSEYSKKDSKFTSPSLQGLQGLTRSESGYDTDFSSVSHSATRGVGSENGGSQIRSSSKMSTSSSFDDDLSTRGTMFSESGTGSNATTRRVSTDSNTERKTLFSEKDDILSRQNSTTSGISNISSQTLRDGQSPSSARMDIANISDKSIRQQGSFDDVVTKKDGSSTSVSKTFEDRTAGRYKREDSSMSTDQSSSFSAAKSAKDETSVSTLADGTMAKTDTRKENEKNMAASCFAASSTLLTRQDSDTATGTSSTVTATKKTEDGKKMHSNEVSRQTSDTVIGQGKGSIKSESETTSETSASESKSEEVKEVRQLGGGGGKFPAIGRQMSDESVKSVSKEERKAQSTKQETKNVSKQVSDTGEVTTTETSMSNKSEMEVCFQGETKMISSIDKPVDIEKDLTAGSSKMSKQVKSSSMSIKKETSSTSKQGVSSSATSAMPQTAMLGNKQNERNAEILNRSFSTDSDQFPNSINKGRQTSDLFSRQDSQGSTMSSISRSSSHHPYLVDEPISEVGSIRGELGHTSRNTALGKQYERGNSFMSSVSDDSIYSSLGSDSKLLSMQSANRSGRLISKDSKHETDLKRFMQSSKDSFADSESTSGVSSAGRSYASTSLAGRYDKNFDHKKAFSPRGGQISEEVSERIKKRCQDIMESDSAFAVAESEEIIMSSNKALRDKCSSRADRDAAFPAGKSMGQIGNISISGRESELSSRQLHNKNTIVRDEMHNRFSDRKFNEGNEADRFNMTYENIGNIRKSLQTEGRDGQMGREEDLRYQNLSDMARFKNRDISRRHEPNVPMATDDKAPWEQRRERIDKALSWIRSELGLLRAQDKVLMSQFQRCQDTIEQIKKQRPWYEDDYDEEDDRHWEDWEIEEFDRSCERREAGERCTEPKGKTHISHQFQHMSMTEDVDL